MKWELKRILYEISSMIIHILRSPPLPIPFPSPFATLTMKPSFSSSSYSSSSSSLSRPERHHIAGLSHRFRFSVSRDFSCCRWLLWLGLFCCLWWWVWCWFSRSLSLFSICMNWVTPFFGPLRLGVMWMVNEPLSLSSSQIKLLAKVCLHGYWYIFR